MQMRLMRLRFRRRLRQRQQQVGGLGQQAEQNIERHLFRRFENLNAIRRFLFAWLGLMILLIGGVVIQIISLSNYYQTLHPVPGGIYSEGVSGRFTNASPLFATSDADSTVSRLVFAGLFTYNDNDRLTGDLAQGYSVDTHGTTYTVHLRPHLSWQDGRPLTSSDVLFTYQMIQNPDTQSPLRSSWQGITVTAPDADTVVFKLPGGLAAFPNNLTNGIVPRHLLAGIAPADLRSADFNTVHPVGAGPFAWQALAVRNGNDPDHAVEQIALTPFSGYARGRPKLQKFEVHIFADRQQLAQTLAGGQLTAAEGLATVPRQIAATRNFVQHSILLRAADMIFFKTSSGVMADKQVRQALVQGADVPRIVKGLGYTTHTVREPLLDGQVGYDPALVQPGYNPASAKALLDSDGWTAGPAGYRIKAGQTLGFSLSAADTPEDHLVTRDLQNQWRQLGVRLNVQLQNPSDFQNTLSYHSYDSVLYGISIGADPDVFVYWDSSQADIRSANRLNLSEWKNPTADASLEAGRTRIDPTLRTIKYRPFLQAWQQDAPALGLYQPRLLYLTNGQVAGLPNHAINTNTDRFDNVQNWEIHQAKVTRQP
jgi:peptide/nickel transport system substrate-binding protein